MGMDVYGKNPTSEVGQYFRNNVWYWHPLWECCEYFFPEITEKVKNAHDNSGDGLNSKDSRKLGFFLQEKISQGEILKYIEVFDEEKESLEPLDCGYCNFKEEIEGSVPDASKKTFYLFKTEHCKLCKGTGKVENYYKHYHMSLENVQKFADFLKDCGGFEIC